MGEGTTRIEPSTPLPGDKKDEMQGSPTGVELFPEMEETARGWTTEGCMVEELDETELPTETRFIFLYYNRSSGKWTEEQDPQYDDGSSDDGGIDEGELDGMELPTETRFIIIYYNRSSGKWTE